MGSLYIEDTLKESTNLMNRMGMINEESINKKKQEMEDAMAAIDGQSSFVDTFYIITGQNPNGNTGDNRTNRIGNKRLKEILKAGHYTAVPVKGKYGMVEDSYIVFNIPLDVAKNIANELSQESFIYGRKQENKVVFELYMMDESTGEYQFVESKDYYEDKKDNDDYFTEIGDKKFSLPFDTFKEGIEKNKSIIKDGLN